MTTHHPGTGVFLSGHLSDHLQDHHPDQESPLLAISCGIEPRGHIAQKVSAAARHGGALAGPEETIPWPVTRVVLHQGTSCLAGPSLEGEPLEALLPREPGQAVPSWLTPFLQALIRELPRERFFLCNIRTSLVTPRGEVLLLDSRLCQEINQGLPGTLRNEVHEPYWDDRLGRQAAADPLPAAVYQIGAIIFHALTGAPPLGQAPAGETPAPRPIQSLRPEVIPPVATVLDELLQGERQADLEALRQILEAVRTHQGRWLDDISPRECQARKAAALEEFHRDQRQRRGKTFWRKNRSRIAVIAAVTLVLSSIPIAMIRNRLAPPATAGLTPLELVQGFYRAWNDLDHLFLDDATAKGVARATIREVTNLYVIDRVQTAHERHSRFRTPREWQEAGSPPDLIPYGISDLVITPLGEEDQALLVQAEYALWRPEGAASEEQDQALIIVARTRDLLRIEPSRHGWIITEITSSVKELEEIIPE
ncbi:hypothetical protein AU468_00670 [Alkalispirochaeta sphaeroplastigenens]|uniref:Protein kinase domain-containing protein n=1 Tax=Alkalispirochaeta sphaeroplastigenens TaxID=1187066 RepID=A0A2S4K0X6_9SPIO|nr:hypothetical protein [Alkalispirochaeta sphaeroplastigenens]POR05422.1 hypothetical protein AU468_00670 [Alkalispirochaeta sphaeroplastigenens]